MEELDVCVIGAGVIGLAIAAEFARSGREVLVLESGDSVGAGISSRNSGVIHAGIHYPPGSLKSRLCVRGREMLYAFCRSHHVDHRQCGKLIVATDPGQCTTLEHYRRQAGENGVTDLEWFDADAARRREPGIRAHAALFSPSTGIIDSHGLCVALQAELEQGGGDVALHTPVSELELTDKGVRISAADTRLRARTCINAAGLAAASLASSAGIEAVPRYFAKGHYFQYTGPSPFRHLVYPIADSAGLGIHSTLDLAGRTRFGPDVQWIEEPDYEFDESRKSRFVDAIRRYYPDLDSGRLVPDSTGIRPKLVPAGQPPADFRPQRQASGGGEIIHMLGIESPGLTAALAIAEHVRQIVETR